MSSSRILVCAEGNREDLVAMDDVMPIMSLMPTNHVSRGINSFEHFKAVKEETSRMCYTEPTLIVVRHGRGTVVTHNNGQKATHRFQPESVGLFPPGFEHLCSPMAGNEFFCLTISELMLRDTAEEIFPGVKCEEWYPVLGMQESILSHMTIALRELVDENPESRLLLETLTQSILIRLVEVACVAKNRCYSLNTNHRLHRSTARIERVIESLQNEPSKDFGLEEMAKLASLSPAYFSRIFKSFTGMSPSAFQTQERIKIAERMMRMDDDRPLSEIAVAVGFHSVQGLRRAYERTKGKPMRRWANALSVSPPPPLNS